MMSGLRSHLAYTITCVSERSGIASSFVFLIAFHPSTMATATKRKIRNLFLSLNSIILFIIGIAPRSSTDQRRGPLRHFELRRRRPQAYLRRRSEEHTSELQSLRH